MSRHESRGPVDWFLLVACALLAFVIAATVWVAVFAPDVEAEPRPIDVALLASADSAIVVTARGPALNVERSQAAVRRQVGAYPCKCSHPDAWLFLQVTGPAPGELALIDAAGRVREPADPCALGGRGRSPFASRVALNFAFFGIRPDDVRGGTWADSSGRRTLVRWEGGD